MEASVTEDTKKIHTSALQKGDEDAHSKRMETVRTIGYVTTGLIFASAAVSIGCMLIKNKNGLTAAENFFKNCVFESDKTAEHYLRFVAKKGIHLEPHQLPAPDQIDGAKRLYNNALGAGGIFLILAPLSQIGGFLAQALYLRATKPEKQSER